MRNLEVGDIILVGARYLNQEPETPMIVVHVNSVEAWAKPFWNSGPYSKYGFCFCLDGCNHNTRIIGHIDHEQES